MVEHAIVSSCVVEARSHNVEAGSHNVERLTVALLQLLDKCALLIHNQKIMQVYHSYN